MATVLDAEHTGGRHGLGRGLTSLQGKLAKETHPQSQATGKKIVKSLNSEDPADWEARKALGGAGLAGDYEG